jgi:hypothetical protein
MAIERVTYDSDDTPVEYANDLFVGDRTTVIAWAHGEIKPAKHSQQRTANMRARTTPVMAASVNNPSPAEPGIG